MHTRRGEGGKGEGKYRTPHANFKTLVNKIAIKPEIGEPPGSFSWKPFPPPPRDFGKNLSYPLPWIFNPCASMKQIVIFSG
jgi:hypothetical protein